MKATAVAPLRFVPVILTEVPAVPLDGENELIVGELATVTVTEEVAELRTASSARAVSV